jgi:hypothetical protein
MQEPLKCGDIPACTSPFVVLLLAQPPDFCLPDPGVEDARAAPVLLLDLLEWASFSPVATDDRQVPPSKSKKSGGAGLGLGLLAAAVRGRYRPIGTT